MHWAIQSRCHLHLAACRVQIVDVDFVVVVVVLHLDFPLKQSLAAVHHLSAVDQCGV